MKYENVANLVYNQPWAIHPAKYAILLELIDFRARGGMLTLSLIHI